MSARAAAVTLRVAVRKGLADRGGLFVGVGFYVVVIAVLGSLWRTATGAGEIAGYTALALTWYVATTEAATVPINARLIEDIGYDIGTGAVAVEMLRPISLLTIRLSTELGRALPRLAACMLAGAAVAWLTAGPPAHVGALALAVPSLVLAVAANLVGMHAFAGAGFWLRDTKSTWFLYQKFVFLVGGMLIPLEVLPGPVEAIGRALPFMAMAYAPGRLAAGFFEPHLLLVQAGWLVVLWLATANVYAAGERRLQAVGG